MQEGRSPERAWRNGYNTISNRNPFSVRCPVYIRARVPWPPMRAAMITPANRRGTRDVITRLHRRRDAQRLVNPQKL